MTESDDQIRRELKRGQASVESGRAPEFESAWAGAEARAAERRGKVRVAGTVAAAAAIAAIVASLLLPQEQGWQYVDPDEFLSSTSWAAPSDVLLPDHQFDIYGQIPVLIESTRTDEGTLL